jgi:type IV secretion system protein VirD4
MPKPHRAILPALDDPVALGREGDAPDLTVVALERRSHEAAVELPQPYRAIPSARNDPVALGREGDASNPALVASEGLGCGAAVEMPKPHRAVLPARDDPVALGREGDAPELAVMTLERRAVRRMRHRLKSRPAEQAGGLTPREMSAPTASFEDPAVIVRSPSLRYDPKKLFLGVIGASKERDQKTGQRYVQGGVEIGAETDQHAVLVAGSRAGKGRACIQPNLLRYAGSVLAIDPKGELALATAKARMALGQKVCVIDPFNTTKGKLERCRCGFNPVEQMLRDVPPDDPERKPESLIEDAMLIADALVLKAGHDPHWDESALTFIEGVILEVATADRFEGRRDLVTVRNLIAEGEAWAVDNDDDSEDAPTGMDFLEEHMRESEEPAVRRAAADFFERPERERASVLAVARRHLRVLAFPEIERSLRGEGIDLSELKTSAMTIYLCLPGRHMGTCGRWLRLFVNLALQAMERTPGYPAAGCPVLFVLDEFASLGFVAALESAAGQIAGFGVKLWIILQDLGQLKSLYKDRWETFMGNAGILQFFGNNDLTTLEWISKRLGTTTIEQFSSSGVTPGAQEAGAEGESWSPRTTAVMEPHEIALIFGLGDPLLRQLIIQAGFAPMILQRAYYDKHNAFARIRP